MEDFKVPCGNWLYPARDTATSAVYPIDMPLVVEIFPESKNAGEKVSSNWRIDHHLSGPRFIKLSFPKKTVLRLDSLGSESEELFNQAVGFEIRFKPAKLARANHLWRGGKYQKSMTINDQTRLSDWRGIFFTSILLQHYLADGDFPEGITFRKATMPEIESLGTW